MFLCVESKPRTSFSLNRRTPIKNGSEPCLVFSRFCQTEKFSACGIFRTFDPRLQLTAEGEKKPIWCLPRWFEKKGMTYHAPDKFKGRYEKDQSKVLLQSACRDQEFVLDLGDDTTTAAEWLNQIFGYAK